MQGTPVGRGREREGTMWTEGEGRRTLLPHPPTLLRTGAELGEPQERVGPLHLDAEVLRAARRQRAACGAHAACRQRTLEPHTIASGNCSTTSLTRPASRARTKREQAIRRSGSRQSGEGMPGCSTKHGGTKRATRWWSRLPPRPSHGTHRSDPARCGCKTRSRWTAPAWPAPRSACA